MRFSGIVFLACGIALFFSTNSIKKNPGKILNTEKRQKKSSLSDEEYIESVCKTRKICGAIVGIAGIVQALLFWSQI